MDQKKNIIVLATISLMLIAGLMILPFFGEPEYSIIRNTPGESGAQSAPHALIINLIFISLALSSLITGWNYYKGFILHRMILLLFVLMLILMAIFNHAPISPKLPYNLMEDGWHDYFACSTAISFIILSISTAYILKNQAAGIWAFIAGVSVLILSVLSAEAARYAGIWQRIVFLIYTLWMLFTYKNGRIRDVSDES